MSAHKKQPISFLAFKSRMNDLVDLILAGLVIFIMAILRILPLSLASALMGRIACLLGPHTGANKTARANLSQAFPHLSASELETITNDMWDNFGRVLGELPHIATMKVPKIIEIIGGDIVRDAMKESSPVLIFSAHLGNWEVLPRTCRDLDIDVATVYRRINNPYLDNFLNRLRRQFVGTIPKGVRGSRKIIKRLKKGGAIALLADQKLNEGLAVPLFGRDAMTATSPADMALRYACTVIPVHVERIANSAKFRITYDSPMEFKRTQDHRTDTYEFLLKMNGIMERWIRKNPGQWFWMHRRWPPKKM